MGGKKKLKRFRDNENFQNVIQPKRWDLINEKFLLKGKWNLNFFRNNSPIVLELGCGKGEYSLFLADKYPNKNYIGIDIKGARFWKGAKSAIENKIQNVAFLRTQIELLNYCFEENEIDEIWITFPDPQIKLNRTKHRLTNPEMLNIYKNIIKKKGIIHLKTDSGFLYGYTLGCAAQMGKVIYAHHDIYNNENSPLESTAIQTFYEKKFLEQNKPIKYMKFRL